MLLSRALLGASFDVLVIGGGHAGCEAASCAATMGANTLLLTHKIDTIGEMSCNPSFGGIGKGHLMREIDALDGVSPLICDSTGINYRVLNRSKGPAVWGLRAQIDRTLYRTSMQNNILNTHNLTVRSAAVEDLLIQDKSSTNPKVTGVKLADNSVIHAETVVVTTGTFLKGQIFLGLETRPAGRIGDDASYGLSHTLDSLGFRLSRLRTGTPPRLDGKTINYNNLEVLDGDQQPTPFSFMSHKVSIAPGKQIACHITETNARVGDLCRKYLHLNKHVLEEANGPRYCPSLESKIIKFNKDVQRIIIEPEGLESDVKYPQGMSMTFPADIQQRIVNEIDGLQNAIVIQPGYGVQYDYVDPRQLYRNLETKLVDGLFLAGQINGTTGYEEAAAQGLIAGINAAAKVQKKPALILDRTNSYIGVMLDDLTSVGTVEPYRMFTSRAEFRLYLRPDNADIRLTELGHKMGAVNSSRYEKFSKLRSLLNNAIESLSEIRKTRKQWRDILPSNLTQNMSSQGADKSGLEILAAFDIPFEQILNCLPEVAQKLESMPNELQMNDLNMRLKCESLYNLAIHEMKDQMLQIQQEASLELPSNVDYSSMLSISTECRHVLMEAQPQTIGAASRIPGMTPASLFNLLRIVKKNELNLCI